MTLELSILYYLATLTVVLKRILIKLLIACGEKSCEPQNIASKERAVHNAIRSLIIKGEIAEETVPIKRKGKKPLMVDYFRITRQGIARLKVHGEEQIPWAPLLREDVSQIIGSGRTKEDLATRYGLLSSAAMMALSVGAAEFAMSPTEDSSGQNALSDAVRKAMRDYRQETDAYIVDDTAEPMPEAPLYVPALNIKRKLAERNGIVADNEKRSGQCTGAFFLPDRIIVAYTSLPHSVPSFLDRDLKKDVALVQTYAKDILGKKVPPTISAILFVSDPKTFAAAYAAAVARTTEVDQGKFSYRKMRMTVFVHYDTVTVVTLNQFGKKDLLQLLCENQNVDSELTEDLVFGGAYRRTSSVELSYGTKFFPIITADSGIYTSIVRHLDMLELAHYQTIKRMQPSARFRVLCRDDLLDYCKSALEDIEVLSLETHLKDLGLAVKYSDLLYPPYKPRMQIEIESARMSIWKQEWNNHFQKPKRKYTRRKDPSENRTDTTPNTHNIPVIHAQLLTWDD